MWGERAEKTVQRSKIAVLSISLLCYYNFSELKERANKGSAVCQEQENALTCYLHSVARISVGKQQILQDNKLQISYLKQIRSIYNWNAGVFISVSTSASISQNLCYFSHCETIDGSLLKCPGKVKWEQNMDLHWNWNKIIIIIS